MERSSEGVKEGENIKRVACLKVILHGFFDAWIESSKNVRIDGYEIDVLISYKNRKIAVECKQYERSQIVVRNLIYQ